VNIIGSRGGKLRICRFWMKEDLVVKLQVLGCYMSRDIRANTETRRCVATDTQIGYFVDVFEVDVRELFPPRPQRADGSVQGRIVGIAADFVTRKRCADPDKAHT